MLAFLTYITIEKCFQEYSKATERKQHYFSSCLYARKYISGFFFFFQHRCQIIDVKAHVNFVDVFNQQKAHCFEALFTFSEGL